MLLRRITQHVRDQNWFAVFIDFIIVVVGVFIGIQVNNWNTQRIEDSLEHEYLQRFENNLLESIENTIRTNKRWVERINHLSSVIDSLDACQLDENNKELFAEGIYHIGKFEMAYFNNLTLEEMKSTGRLGVIKNVDINKTIESVERDINYQKRVEPQMIAHISPHLFYIKQRVRFEIKSITDYKNLSNDNIQYASIANYDFDALCTDPIFIASIYSVRATVIEILEWNDRIAQRMGDALKLIQKDLGG